MNGDILLKLNIISQPDELDNYLVKITGTKSKSSWINPDRSKVTKDLVKAGSDEFRKALAAKEF